MLLASLVYLTVFALVGFGNNVDAAFAGCSEDICARFDPETKTCYAKIAHSRPEKPEERERLNRAIKNLCGNLAHLAKNPLLPFFTQESFSDSEDL
jgi:hypothetical protein